MPASHERNTLMDATSAAWAIRAMQAPVFARVPQTDLARLFAVSTHLQIRDEHSIFHRGDPVTAAYLVLAGSVRISTLAPSGKRIIVEIFQRNEPVRRDRRDRWRSADSRGDGDGAAQLVSIPSGAFQELLSTSAELANNVLRMVINRLRRTYSLLEDASLRPLELRLAKQVLYLARLGATGDTKVRLQSRMHQDELADLLGVTTRSIINVLNKWRADNLVSFDGRTAQLTVLDMARFRTIAEE